MSEEYQIMLPKLGESIVSATVVQWFKKEGDAVLLDEPLLEVSTDKVNSEIPSPVAGVLERIVAKVDEEVQVGEMLAVVRRQGGVVTPLPPTETTSRKEVSVAQEENKDYFSPAVLRVAAERGISLDSLQKMKGTGSGGRITKQDVENFESSAPSPCPLQKSKAQEISSGEEERLKMTGIRKAIADNMVKSFYEAPHATLINEIDVTAIMKKIQAEKESFYTRYGVKLTVTSFVLQALAKALVEFPLLNSFLDKDTIVLKKYVNVGVAVSIEQGLIVPVVKNCQKMTLPEIAQHVHDLSEKARTGRLLPGDVIDGTITLTNFGMSGVSIGVPIIRYPEVAILGMGAIKKRVQVMEGDMLAIRSMLYFSLTFDHRVIDGMYGCSFLSSLQRHLQNP